MGCLPQAVSEFAVQIVLSQVTMNLWSGLGVSVALAAIFCIVATELLPFCGGYKWYICAALLTTGLTLLLVGRGLNASASKGKANETGAEEETGSGRGIRLTYWGLMLMVFGVILIFITPTRSGQIQSVAARSPPKLVAPAATNTPSHTNAVQTATNKPVVFPTLRLQGLTFREGNPSALINGYTYFVGDFVGDAKVIWIDTERVVLEQEGYYQVLSLKVGDQEKRSLWR